VAGDTTKTAWRSFTLVHRGLNTDVFTKAKRAGNEGFHRRHGYGGQGILKAKWRIAARQERLKERMRNQFHFLAISFQHLAFSF